MGCTSYRFVPLRRRTGVRHSTRYLNLHSRRQRFSLMPLLLLSASASLSGTRLSREKKAAELIQRDFSCHLFSYLIIIKGLMPNVVASLYHDLTSETTNPPAWALDGGNWVSIFMLILVPLCFLRHIDSLRHTSYIALFSVGEPTMGFLGVLR